MGSPTWSMAAPPSSHHFLLSSLGCGLCLGELQIFASWGLAGAAIPGRLGQWWRWGYLWVAYKTLGNHHPFPERKLRYRVSAKSTQGPLCPSRALQHTQRGSGQEAAPRRAQGKEAPQDTGCHRGPLPGPSPAPGARILLLHNWQEGPCRPEPQGGQREGRSV